MISVDDSTAVTLSYSPLPRKRSSSFSQLQCHKYLKPSTVERVFRYTVKHVTELLSCCHPNLLIKWCEHLMASDIHGIKLFTADFIDKIKQLKNSNCILKMLNHYWTWSNYSILKVLVQFSKLATDMLEEFDTRLNVMLPVAEYPLASFVVSMLPYDTTVLMLECNQTLNKYSLQRVFDMQLLMVESCDITQHTLLLIAVNSNPTRFYWMIPKSVITIVNTKVLQHRQLLFSKGVMKIFIGLNIVHATKKDLPYMFWSDVSNKIL